MAELASQALGKALSSARRTRTQLDRLLRRCPLREPSRQRLHTLWKHVDDEVKALAAELREVIDNEEQEGKTTCGPGT